MQNVIEKADVLIEALPYIQRFRGDTVVVKFGGSVMEDQSLVDGILKDIAFMECVGLRPVLVHGGGKAISRELREAGIKAEFMEGLRVTDDDTIGVVERVLNHEVNPAIVKKIQAYDCKARGIHGDHILTADKLTQTNSETGEVLEWGHVGAITDVDTEPINAYLQAQIVPVITPLARGEDKTLYNSNADEAAAAIAEKLGARKLVFLSDVPGVLMDHEDPESIVSTLDLSQIEQLISRGVIAGGMLPKIAGATRALEAGVLKTHIIDSSMPHSLLLELFTDKGVGTEIVK